MAAIKQVWDQNQGFKDGKRESDAAYRRFRDFLELGKGRKLMPIAVAHNVSIQAIQQASFRYEWKARAAAWDKEQRKLQREGKKAAQQQPPPVPLPPPEPPSNPDANQNTSAVEAEIVPGAIQPSEDPDGYAKGLDEFRRIYGRLGYRMALESWELFPTIAQLREDIAEIMKLRKTAARQNDTTTAMALSEIITKQIPQYAKFCDTMIALANAGRQHWGAVVGIEEILEEAYGNKKKG